MLPDVRPELEGILGIICLHFLPGALTTSAVYPVSQSLRSSGSGKQRHESEAQLYYRLAM